MNRSGKLYMLTKDAVYALCFMVSSCLVLAVTDSFADNKKFVILTASYNNIDYYKWNLDSVFRQTYTDWKMIYIDDMSTDGTGDAVRAYIKAKGFEDKVTFVSNTHKCFCLKNYYREIHKLANDAIVITLDGDDALEDSKVLSYLNKVYNDPTVWCTYGNFRYHPLENLRVTPITLEPFPDEIVEENKFREYKWNIHHLRSFYAGLFKNIRLQDLLFEGQFFPVGEDLSFMFPIIEQSGTHHRFIDKVLYVYNVGNPLITVSVWKRELRKSIWEYIYSKPEYEPLKNPPYETNKDKVYRAHFLIFNDAGPQELRACLSRLKKYMRSNPSIFVLCDNLESEASAYTVLKKDFPNVILVDKEQGVESVLKQAQERFIVICSDQVRVEQTVRLSFLIHQLEKTGAAVAYLKPFDSFLNNEKQPVVTLEAELSAFQFKYFTKRPKSAEYIALFRKQDVLKKCRGKSCNTLRELRDLLEKKDSEKIGLVVHEKNV